MKVLSLRKRAGLLIRDLVLFIVIFSLSITVFSLPLELLNTDNWSTYALLIISQSITLLALSISWLAMRRIRSFPSYGMDFSIKGRGIDMLAGFLTASALYAIGFVISLLMGWIEIVSIQLPWTTLLLSWFFFLLVAIFEEGFVRGFVLGKLLDSGISKGTALIFSSLLFSFMHFFNPNFALVPCINLTLAGILLGASYIYTRNLWFPIFLHWYWNWLQGPVLGYGVSGQNLGPSLFSLSFNGTDIWSGQNFGFEGTLLCTILMIITTWIIIKIVKPKKASTL